MRIKKNDKQVQQFGDAINARVTEFFDGHVVVGFIAGTNEPLIIYPEGQDQKTVLGLNSLLIAAVRPAGA